MADYYSGGTPGPRRRQPREIDVVCRSCRAMWGVPEDSDDFECPRCFAVVRVPHPGDPAAPASGGPIIVGGQQGGGGFTTGLGAGIGCVVGVILAIVAFFVLFGR